MGLLEDLQDESMRAQIMWQHRAEPAVLVSLISEAAYGQAGTDGTLLENECGAAAATMGAAMLYEVYTLAHMAPGQAVSAEMLQYTYDAADFIRHAAEEHNLPMAVQLKGEDTEATFLDVVANIEAWVEEHLLDSLTEVIELFEVGAAADFAEWEA